MRLGIIINIYNRPLELFKCLDSLRKAIIPKDTLILLIDDASNDARTKQIFKEFELKDCEVQRITNKRNLKIAHGIKTGYEYCFNNGCKYALNLDSDCIVRPDFIEVLLNLKKKFLRHIITGFNCVTKNSNGTERHMIIKEGNNYNLKKSVGGINMLLDRHLFNKYVSPACYHSITYQGNWDHMACIASMKNERAVVCSVPSVIQHIGFVSSMGHTYSEPPDIADDFYLHDLSKVTLLGVDCVDVNRLAEAMKRSMQYIKFGAVRCLTSRPFAYRFKDDGFNKNIYRVRDLTSKQAYSEFMLKEMNDYFDTEFVLVVQYDGYVINARAWDNSFLKYDYIGASWWFKDNMNVGNGGFSLRSKKLQRILQNDKEIKPLHPEDETICRTYRPYLESKKIKFAPEEMANRFSIEAHNTPAKQYNGAFGFHGNAVKF